MDVLFITSSRIGDAVLSTGLLSHIEQKYPSARVTIVCGPLAESLFEGYPKLKRIIPLRKQPYNAHWMILWAEIASERWDIVVDLRNSLVSRLVRADKHYALTSKIDKKLHKVEQNAVVMGLNPPPAPKLWFSQYQAQDAKKLIPAGGSVLGVGPAANWSAKTWPADRFIEIIKFMTGPDGSMSGARVAVFAARGEEKAAHEVLRSIPDGRGLDVIAKADPGTAAAALARCGFYIGNDSGLMHCAAAAGVPTLGLFGPSWPQIYRPWGPHCDYAQTPENFDRLVNYPGYSPKTAPCLMESLTVERVKEKIRGMTPG